MLFPPPSTLNNVKMIADISTCAFKNLQSNLSSEVSRRHLTVQLKQGFSQVTSGLWICGRPGGARVAAPRKLSECSSYGRRPPHHPPRLAQRLQAAQLFSSLFTF